ncbi:TPA: hypothetical protein ACNV4Q_003639, partial [Serratia marcescens]
EGIDDKAFPEQGAKVSIHNDGSFEGLGCVLANTNLNVLTAVFYWFTLKRDEPSFLPLTLPPPSPPPAASRAPPGFIRHSLLLSIATIRKSAFSFPTR